MGWMTNCYGYALDFIPDWIRYRLRRAAITAPLPLNHALSLSREGEFSLNPAFTFVKDVPLSRERQGRYTIGPHPARRE